MKTVLPFSLRVSDPIAKKMRSGSGSPSSLARLVAPTSTDTEWSPLAETGHPHEQTHHVEQFGQDALHRTPFVTTSYRTTCTSNRHTTRFPDPRQVASFTHGSGRNGANRRPLCSIAATSSACNSITGHSPALEDAAHIGQRIPHHKRPPSEVQFGRPLDPEWEPGQAPPRSLAGDGRWVEVLHRRLTANDVVDRRSPHGQGSSRQAAAIAVLSEADDIRRRGWPPG